MRAEPLVLQPLRKLSRLYELRRLAELVVSCSQADPLAIYELIDSRVGRWSEGGASYLKRAANVRVRAGDSLPSHVSIPVSIL